MNFGLNLWNKVSSRMFGLVVIEGMTPSGHLSNINEKKNVDTYLGMKLIILNSSKFFFIDWFDSWYEKDDYKKLQVDNPKKHFYFIKN